MIISINHVSDWRYIRQPKHAKIDKDAIRESTNRISQYYRMGYKVLTLTKSAYKYKILFRGLYEIVHTWTNVTITLRMGAVTMRINTRNIKPYNTIALEGQDPA